MPRPMKRDLSKQAGNPTSEIQAKYQALMAIPTFDELKQAALDIFKSCVGHGFSPSNYQEALGAINEIEANRGKDLEHLQFYLTNYMLKGSGLGVAMDDVERIAAIISESELTEEQLALAVLVKPYFMVVMLD